MRLLHPSGGFPMQQLKGKDVLPILLEGVNNLDCHWWLSAGTLLGFERDGGFIPHDTDLDIGTIGDVPNDLMPAKDYKIIRIVEDEQGRKHQTVWLHKETNVIFDILHWHELNENEYYTESEKGILKRPKEMLDNIAHKEYLGHTWNVPVDIDKYLTIWYDDWRVPISNSKTKWLRK